MWHYTRTSFEVHDGSLGAQSALGGGGRYDGLIEALGGQVVTFIASRFEGGSGVSSAAVDKVLASGAKLRTRRLVVL